MKLNQVVFMARVSPRLIFMNQFFSLINKFTYNTDLLYQEWQKAEQSVNAIERCKAHFNPFYIEMFIGKSRHMDPNMDPLIDRMSFGKIDSQYKDEIKTFSSEDVLNIWKNSYTAYVLKDLDSHMQKKGLKIVSSYYATLLPNTIIPLHVDKEQGIRYFFVVNTSNKVSVTVYDETFPMSEINGLYKLNTRIPHSVKNDGDTPRVTIAFTTKFL
jgi:hypothetical protein